MSDRYVQYDVEDGFATLTLDSPHNRNAISTKLMTELREGLTAAEADSQVRAIVLTHTGATFCAGADLSAASGSKSQDGEAAGGAEAGAEQRALEMLTLLRRFLDTPKPIIASVNGHVRAGGMGLVGACDFAVAGPSSTFALTEARLGLAASIISLTVLPRITSRAAAHYFLTGEKFGPDRACDIGLIGESSADPASSVDRILGELRKASPQGLSESKLLTTAAMRADFDAKGTDLARQSARLFGSEEAAEGMTSFLEKRPPRWALGSAGE